MAIHRTMSTDLERQTQPAPTTEALQHALEIVEQIVDDRGLLSLLSVEERRRLLIAIDRIACPDRSARKKLTRAFKKRDQVELSQQKAQDELLLASTGMRTQPGLRQLKKARPPAPFQPDVAPAADHPEDHFGERLNVPRSCYICKRDYDRLHVFYDSLCPDCADLNWARRQRTADLSGRYALV